MQESDLRFAVRSLARRPGFAAVVVLTLALGIGATTAVFSVTETILIRSLPYPADERLVALLSTSPVRDELDQRVAPGTFADWQELASSFEAITGYRWYTVDVMDSGESERLDGLFVTPEFFEVFGVSLFGRGFLAEDHGTHALILGNDVWHRRFDAVQELVGTSLDLNVRNFDRVGPTP